jgi:hypothetical protein
MEVKFCRLISDRPMVIMFHPIKTAFVATSKDCAKAAYPSGQTVLIIAKSICLPKFQRIFSER